jgi:hypothetical protein
VDLSTGLVAPIVTGMMTPHGALFVSAISDVSIFRSDDLSLVAHQTLDVTFKVERTGNVSKEIHVKYVVKDLGSEKNDDQQFTGTVEIEPGKSEAEFRLPIATFGEIAEDGVTQEVTVILQPGEGYNVVKPATATIKLKNL